MKKKLVFDIGMHIGQDTVNYLAEGFRVVAVEANPQLVEQNKKKFQKHIQDGSLTILNMGISGNEGFLPFYVNKRTSEWSSFDFAIGTRNNTPYEVINVPCTTTAQLFEEYGIPYFMKVDIEGFDYLCVDDLPDVTALSSVKYVSCEDSDVPLLDKLRSKGYCKFKITNQSFHFKPLNLKLEQNRLYHFFLFVYGGLRLRLRDFITMRHPYSSSGPIPEKTKGDWLCYETAKNLLDELKKNRLSISKSWFDIQATY